MADSAAHATPWGRVAALVLAGIAGSVQIGKVPAALTGIGAEFGLGLAGAALLISLFSLLAGLGGLAMGLSAARIGARRALPAGAWLLALSSLAAVFAPGAAPLFLARVAEGAGFLLLVVSAPTLIAAMAAPRDRATAMAIWGTYMPAGIALGLLAAPLSEGLGWRALWLAAAAAMALAALGATLALPRRLPDAPPPPPAMPLRAQLAALVAARHPLWIATTFATYNIVYIGIAGFLPAFLERRFGAATGLAGMVAAGAAAANAAGNLAGGALMRQGHDPVRLVVLAAPAMGLLAAGVFAAAPIIGTGIGTGFVLALLACLLGGVVPASLFALVPRAVPEPALVAPAMGLVIQGNNLGQILAPPAIGALAAGVGWGAVAVPMLGCGLLAMLGARMLAGLSGQGEARRCISR